MSSTAPKLNPPFRADHIGSLKRPAKLLQKRKELDDGKTTQDELRVVEDEAIRNVIRMQREVGIKSITDGEFRRCADIPLFTALDLTREEGTCSTTGCSITWTG